jgi:RNA polymerase sigma-70 factor (ECF subfamily)
MTALEFRYNLIELHQGLMKYAYRLTTNKELAKDLVQETFLRALKNREKFVLDKSLRAWAFTIMKNTFINEYRRSFQQNIYRSRSYESNNVNDTKSIGYDDPSSVYSTSELLNTVEKLDDTFRIPLKMRIKGYKYQEIADELNLNIGTVKSRIFFSRKQLTLMMNR